VSFESTDPALLILYQLARPQCRFGSSRGRSELTGVHWHTHGVIDRSRRYAVGYHIALEYDEELRFRRPSAFTKTRQAQVMRVLRPFIRGHGSRGQQRKNEEQRGPRRGAAGWENWLPGYHGCANDQCPMIPLGQFRLRETIQLATLRAHAR
jgi:hypothetical protein